LDFFANGNDLLAIEKAAILAGLSNKNLLP